VDKVLEDVLGVVGEVGQRALRILELRDDPVLRRRHFLIPIPENHMHELHNRQSQESSEG
jgi:hypothetical protein